MSKDIKVRTPRGTCPQLAHRTTREISSDRGRQVVIETPLMARSGGSLRRSDTSAIGGIADLPSACLKRLS